MGRPKDSFGYVGFQSIYSASFPGHFVSYISESKRGRETEGFYPSIKNCYDLKPDPLMPCECRSKHFTVFVMKSKAQSKVKEAYIAVLIRQANRELSMIRIE